jgi:hypothetical protein
MAQAKGTKAKIGYMAETAFATMPVSPALKLLYFVSESMQEKMNLITSQVLRDNRNPTLPVRGNRDVSGGFRTELAPQLGTLLYAALGAKTSTPTASPSYNTHVLKVGDLPSLVIEKAFTDLPRYLLYLGCKVNRLTISAKPEGFQDVNVELMGAFEGQALFYDAQSGNFTLGLTVTGAGGSTGLIKCDNDASNDGFLTLINPSGDFINNEALTDTATGAATVNGTLGGTSIDTSYTDPGHTPFDGFQVAVIQEGGSDIAYLTAVDLSIENNLDGGNFVLGGGGIRRSIPEGKVKVSGTITALFESMALYNKALNKTETSLKLTYRHGTGIGTVGNESLEIYVPELVISKETPIIEGPQGILYRGPFEAYYNNAAEASAVQITLLNAEAAL